MWMQAAAVVVVLRGWLTLGLTQATCSNDGDSQVSRPSCQGQVTLSPSHTFCDMETASLKTGLKEKGIRSPSPLDTNKSSRCALQCSEGNVKAWYHRAAAQLRLNRLDDAKHSIDSALALDPHNKVSAKALRSKIDAALTRSDERAKRMYKQMFASPSSA
ncbi:hypothetical protein PTSG_04879 [Salpingoeca rosetta]|uniref:Uncharacterized protein n=1 Tax=Salpingoeca rosetta (strain ATCC 50818 / BSB-021) TaxID=946362 RepID=F2U8W3_SALR5|nr:uncharacterized protein PTSG_04879 [Salpingoeca rosetta]EGD73166.1 hypothetical protein PTSG_04879 [Salpingoeca rosetta]|eukprot:XP_004994197.1 hypothetical protein PTSG_04879 [Salpingoeca rosetta]